MPHGNDHEKCVVCGRLTLDINKHIVTACTGFSFERESFLLHVRNNINVDISHFLKHTDIASILWDFFATLGCHDTQNVHHKYNHPRKPTLFICMNGQTKPLFLVRLRLERLTSNQMVGQ